MRGKQVDVKFFKTLSGNEPVKKWLKKLTDDDKLSILSDIKKTELEWPTGEPLIKKICKKPKIWEIRTSLSDGKIGRVLFTIKRSSLILVHAFIKKTQETPKNEIETAVSRIKQISE